MQSPPKFLPLPKITYILDLIIYNGTIGENKMGKNWIHEERICFSRPHSWKSLHYPSTKYMFATQSSIFTSALLRCLLDKYSINIHMRMNSPEGNIKKQSLNINPLSMDAVHNLIQPQSRILVSSTTFYPLSSKDI